MRVGRPCPPVRNDIMTPRHLLKRTLSFYDPTGPEYFKDEMNKDGKKYLRINTTCPYSQRFTSHIDQIVKKGKLHLWPALIYIFNKHSFAVLWNHLVLAQGSQMHILIKPCCAPPRQKSTRTIIALGRRRTKFTRSTRRGPGICGTSRRDSSRFKERERVGTRLIRLWKETEEISIRKENGGTWTSFNQ